jgi:alpha-L-fucosidase
VSAAWWDDARYGLFVHWGVMAIPERGDWVMQREHIPVDEYEALGARFTAEAWNPTEQAALARRAGMRYGVLVTRHHDGFCLWDTATTAFKAPNTPAGRDLVREWTDAFRAEGLEVGLYYSLLDWRFDAYWRGPRRDPTGWAAFRDVVHEQIRELLSGYGDIGVLWYDGFWPYSGGDWGADELAAMARALQPGILLNDRSGAPGDFTTPEQSLPLIPPLTRWEACMTTNDHWGWHSGDHNWKTPADVIHALVRCAAGAGNLLLNIGPKPDGSLPAEAVDPIERAGEWLSVNGASVYGALRSPFLAHAYGPVTCKPGKLYLHCFAEAEDELRLGFVANRATGARYLDGAGELEVRQNGDVLTVTDLVGYALDPYDTVIEVDLDGGPEALAGAYVWWEGDARY